MALQKGDIVKFGRVRFRVIEISGDEHLVEDDEDLLFIDEDPTKTVEEGFNPQQSMITHNPEASSNHEEDFSSIDGDKKDEETKPKTKKEKTC